METQSAKEKKEDLWANSAASRGNIIEKKEENVLRRRWILRLSF